MLMCHLEIGYEWNSNSKDIFEISCALRVVTNINFNSTARVHL